MKTGISPLLWTGKLANALRYNMGFTHLYKIKHIAKENAK